MGEQGKINRPEHTAGGSQNKGTEKLQRGAGPSPLEVGGRGEGKGANSAPEKPPPPTWKTGPLFLSKDFLRPNQRRTLGPQREKVRRTWGEGTQASGCLGHSPRREKARRTQGEGAQASGCLNCSGRGRHKPQAQLNPRFCGGPKNWNRTQCRARSMWSSQEPEQGRRGKHRHHCTGQTQCGRNMGSASHTQRYLSAAPCPPRGRTELN